MVGRGLQSTGESSFHRYPIFRHLDLDRIDHMSELYPLSLEFPWNIIYHNSLKSYIYWRSLDPHFGCLNLNPINPTNPFPIATWDSTGCTAALDIYLQLASKLRLGGFVGSSLATYHDRYPRMACRLDIDDIGPIPKYYMSKISGTILSHPFPPTIKHTESQLNGL
jgi:hypothetical protein